MALFGETATKEQKREYQSRVTLLKSQSEAAKSKALAMKSQTDSFDTLPFLIHIAQFALLGFSLATGVYFESHGFLCFLFIQISIWSAAGFGWFLWTRTRFRQRLRQARHRPAITSLMILSLVFATYSFGSQTRFESGFGDWADDSLAAGAKESPFLRAASRTFGNHAIYQPEDFNRHFPVEARKEGLGSNHREDWMSSTSLWNNALYRLDVRRDERGRLGLRASYEEAGAGGLGVVTLQILAWLICVRLFLRPLYLASEVEFARHARDANNLAGQLHRVQSDFESRYVTAGSWLKLGAAVAAAVVVREVASGLLDSSSGGGEAFGAEQASAPVDAGVMNEALAGPELVDLNGDGIMDETTWGTPVRKIESYMRSTGSVRAHYRTVADGFLWNNLR